ncbi:Prenylcysteine lyase-domain-containing protein [Phlyctochytrium arcticum]|nr:Prenylcysteine lyase-domain-containing protein [Phlyctochytrium arcticum]
MAVQRLAFLCRLWLILLSCVLCQAVDQTPLLEVQNSRNVPVSVAVIGAGASGTGFAYYLSTILPKDSDVKLTIYEETDKIGGRAQALNVSGLIVELGASIFLKENRLLYSAVQEFGLEAHDVQAAVHESGISPWGIWNGQEFLFKASPNKAKMIADMLWRYKLAPITVRRLAREAADAFARAAYNDSNSLEFSDLKQYTQLLGIADYANVTADTFFKNDRAIGEHNKYVEEVVQAATRVNYAQNLDLNAISALVCMAAADGETLSVKGGNERIYHEFVERSGARLILNRRVVDVRPSTGGRSMVTTEPRGEGSRDYDIVIYADPVTQLVPYVRLHVTIVVGIVRAAFFGGNSVDDIPEHIFTHPNPQERFFSLSRLSDLSPLPDGTKRTVYKLFSHERISDADLLEFFVNTTDVYRKEWDSYPILMPTYLWPTNDLIRISRNEWVPGRFESVFSSMESQLVLARKVAFQVADFIANQL